MHTLILGSGTLFEVCHFVLISSILNSLSCRRPHEFSYARVCVSVMCVTLSFAVVVRLSGGIGSFHCVHHGAKTIVEHIWKGFGTMWQIYGSIWQSFIFRYGKHLETYQTHFLKWIKQIPFPKTPDPILLKKQRCGTTNYRYPSSQHPHNYFSMRGILEFSVLLRKNQYFYSGHLAPKERPLFGPRNFPRSLWPPSASPPSCLAPD